VRAAKIPDRTIKKTNWKTTADEWQNVLRILAVHGLSYIRPISAKTNTMTTTKPSPPLG
jgi:hypothetical protein